MSFEKFMAEVRDRMPTIIVDPTYHKHNALITISSPCLQRRLTADRFGYTLEFPQGKLSKERDASALSNAQAAAQYLENMQQTSLLTP